MPNSRSIVSILLAIGLPSISPGDNASKIDREVKAITKSAILIDTHNDIPSFTVDGADIGNSPKNMTDIPRLKQGGVGAVFFSVYVAAKYTDGNHSANRTLQMIDTVKHDIVERYPDTFQFALTAEDIVKAHKKHKIAALMGLEGGHAIEDSPRILRDYYRLGIRYMTLTHTNTNNWADSSGDVTKPEIQHHNGLTPFGKDVIREMNRLGMMVDISHVADKTFYDALETSQAPLIASHSAARAVTNVPRNMTDDMIRALAKKGGVIQMNFYCNFINQQAADAPEGSPVHALCIRRRRTHRPRSPDRRHRSDRHWQRLRRNRMCAKGSGRRIEVPGADTSSSGERLLGVRHQENLRRKYLALDAPSRKSSSRAAAVTLGSLV